MMSDDEPLRRELHDEVELRFVVSVLQILAELERVGDVSLRAIELAPQHLLTGDVAHLVAEVR